RTGRPGGHFRFRPTRGGSFRYPPGAAGRRTGLPSAARSRVPQSAPAAPHRSGQADPVESQHSAPFGTARQYRRARVFVLRGFGRPGRNRAIRVGRRGGARSHLRAALPVRSGDALSVLVPVLEDVLGWNSSRIRSFFAANGFELREWEKVRTDTITLSAMESDTVGQSAPV